MQNFNPSKVSINSLGLILTCTRTGSGSTTLRQWLCGDATVGSNTAGGGTAIPAGYRMVRWAPYQTGTMVIQAVTRWPVNTGEGDPGFWSVGGNWNNGWEIDFPETWGYQKVASGWCPDMMAWPGHLVLGHVTGGHDVAICSAAAWTNDPAPNSNESANPFHTITMEMLPGGAYHMYYDGKLTYSASHSQNAQLGDIIMSYGLRDGPNGHCNWGTISGGGCSGNDTNWPTGTSRTWVFRSVALYENASANNANTTGAPLIAPGTCVIGQNGC